VSTVSIAGAVQVVRPPADGLPYVRLGAGANPVRAEPGALRITDGRIAGFEADPDARVQVDARGGAVVPGFVDCHTHLPFAGWREREYAQKVAGVAYEEIARSGGGIRSSARALAAADDEAVLEQASGLALEMLAHGTTTFETKSGYGLSVAAELRSLALARTLAERVPQTVCHTGLLAHAVPEGFDADGWLDAVAAALPDAVAAAPLQALDIYVESVAFANEHLTRMGELARAHGLRLRAHVEQFSTLHSVPVAVAAGARSVDHLACLPEDEAEVLASAETAAVLLPGAEFLGMEHVPPVAALAEAGAIGVLASDLNPGTSPVASLPLIMGLAVRRYGWTAATALVACTLNAAWVLELAHELGSLELGKRGDVLVLDGPIERIPYRLGHNPVAVVFREGRLVHVRPDWGDRVSAGGAPQ
jgi:imidazolonepropionase